MNPEWTRRRAGASASAARLVAALLAGAASAAADVDYRLDDGSGAFNIGPSQFDAQMLWGNYFDAAPGGEVIDSISVSFAGSVPLNQPVWLFVFEDPDDDLNPANAVPLASTSGLTAAAAPNTFFEFDLPNVQVSGGFFVAALMDLQQGQVAARMDNSTNSGRSWLFFDGVIDLDNLGGSPLFYNMADTPFAGTWMVRARGVPEPSTAAGWALLAILLPRRRAWLTGRSGEADEPGAAAPGC